MEKKPVDQPIDNEAEKVIGAYLDAFLELDMDGMTAEEIVQALDEQAAALLRDRAKSGK